jgi:hypothetical protein
VCRLPRRVHSVRRRDYPARRDRDRAEAFDPGETLPLLHVDAELGSSESSASTTVTVTGGLDMVGSNN